MVLSCAAVVAQPETTIWHAPKPSQFKGSNYLPCTSLGFSQPLNMLPWRDGTLEGAFSELQVEAEIARLKLSGVNVLRVFGSFYGWVTWREGYMTNLGKLAEICARYEMGITYVMWNTTSNVVLQVFDFVSPDSLEYDLSLHLVLQASAAAYTASGSNIPVSVIQDFNEPWQYVLYEEPGNILFRPPFDGVMASWPNNLGSKCEAYIDAIGEFFATDSSGRDVYASYDLFNEGDCCGLDVNNEIELLGQTYARLFQAHQVAGAPVPEFTYGVADYNSTQLHYQTLLNSGIKQSYLSYHCYEAQPLFDQVAQANAGFGEAVRLPVVCSEFYDRTKPGHLGNLSGFLGELQSHGIAGQVWGVLSTNLIFEEITNPGVYLRLDGMWIPFPSPAQSFTSPIRFLRSEGVNPDLQALGNW